LTAGACSLNTHWDFTAKGVKTSTNKVIQISNFFEKAKYKNFFVIWYQKHEKFASNQKHNYLKGGRENLPVLLREFYVWSVSLSYLLAS
jgi:hypothetical protein